MAVFNYTKQLCVAICLYSLYGFTLASLGGVDPTEFKQFVRKNEYKFRSEKSQGNVNYSLKYVPEELKTIGAFYNGEISQKEADQLLLKGKNQLTLLLELQSTEQGNSDFLKAFPDSIPFEKRVKYYAFEFQEDIAIRDQYSQILPVKSYHFERDFGLSGKGSFVLIVNTNKKVEELNVQLKNKLVGNEEIQLNLSVPSLPKLKQSKKWKNPKQ